MNKEECKPIIDALIFAADAPLSIQRIKQILEEVSREQIQTKDIREIIEEINRGNRDQGRGFFLQEVAGGYQYRTRPNYAPWIKKIKKTKSFRLTQSTLETVAIIAYKQPIIRADIEKIRGVDSGGIIKNLLERNIIKIVGRKNIPGRPFLFGTTRKFLEIFGLEKLSELPTLKEFENLDESQLPTILRNKLSENMPESSEVRDDDNDVQNEIVTDEVLGATKVIEEQDTNDKLLNDDRQHNSTAETVDEPAAEDT